MGWIDTELVLIALAAMMSPSTLNGIAGLVN